MHHYSINLNENFYNAYCEKGELLLGLCDHDEALKTYSKAIEINKNKCEAYIGKALVYLDLGDYHSAFPLAKKAHEIEPENEWCTCYYNIIEETINRQCKSNKNVLFPFK
ncbi:tetratricopeptide repeat protein [Clostridium haemolyticum]|uniref:tetratricopeptide repeat protein n=1 Tax=Clostridium haemolyticum TaxID=84025 RepID=UPI000B00F968|nr:tetratricopeptide repeat protein [Clostridium haemolyticum]